MAVGVETMDLFDPREIGRCEICGRRTEERQGVEKEKKQREKKIEDKRKGRKRERVFLGRRDYFVMCTEKSRREWGSKERQREYNG